MKYRNTKTGFVFESEAECKGENIEVILDVSPVSVEEAKEPKKTKAPAKKRTSK